MESRLQPDARHSPPRVTTKPSGNGDSYNSLLRAVPARTGDSYDPPSQRTYSGRANVSASATAVRIALDLFTVSSNSPSGVESFTQPPPTWT